MNVCRASFCAELVVLRMSLQIKQVSPGRAVKVSDDSGLDTVQGFLCKLQMKSCSNQVKISILITLSGHHSDLLKLGTFLEK